MVCNLCSCFLTFSEKQYYLCRFYAFVLQPLTAEWTYQVGITKHYNMNNVSKKTSFKYKITGPTHLFP